MVTLIRALMTTLAALVAGLAVACPMPEENVQKAALFEQLKTAQTHSQATSAADALWRIWTTAPDQQSQEWLDDGMSRIRLGDLQPAQRILSELIAYCPSYAEGYNQLAFAQFLSQNYTESAANLTRALALEPKHFGALGGMGLIAQRQGNVALAKIWVRRALAVHPFLGERRILDLPDKTDDL